MNKVEKRLGNGKELMDSIKAPESMELRLKKALDRATVKRKKHRAPMWITTAVVIFFSFFIGYHYNAVAFYGKKIFGFDEVMSGTLKELNEQGMGQVVDQEKVLKGGNRLMVDGVMADENQLIVYYTVKNSDGIDPEYLLYPIEITGFLSKSIGGGTMSLSEDGTELKGVYSFEPVSPFAKKLTMHYREDYEDGQMSDGSITFSYNPNEAFKTVMKQSLKKTFKVDKGTISIKSITATPTMTVIEGTLNVENYDRVPSPLDGIELIANGQSINQIGSGRQTGLTGTKFDIKFDTLPKQLDSLKLVMKKFVGYKTVDEQISLDEVGDEPFTVGEKELFIKEVSKTTEGVTITIATDEDVMLDGVSIDGKAGNTPLKTTLNQTYIEHGSGRILKERTLLFATEVEPDALLIEGMHYMKVYDQEFDIPTR
ncbi:DUF4179 domain-containing protein [Bacillus niameyensis]|uniref:DUF4179 domain-containing protein n=1 Tax=Bacillus niameyensis TaxID=1522308 RepID=UPI000785FB21|nr:DUF4179 domain-containing protein [Bacillus niameyensis]